jgi:dCTP deaminase
LILTDREIQVAIDVGQVIVSPRPDASAYSSTSLDLTLSNSIQEWLETHDGSEPNIVDPGARGYSYNDFAKRFSEKKTMANAGYTLEPHGFILGWTQENIELPVNSRLAARVEGKSSLARIGLGVHITAPTIHAGFKGTIQLEICNHGSLRVRLRAGMPVCQLILEQTLGTPVKGYGGQFYGQAAR